MDSFYLVEVKYSGFALTEITAFYNKEKAYKFLAEQNKKSSVRWTQIYRAKKTETL